MQNKIRSENISVWLIADKNARYIFCEPALAQHKEFKTVTAMRILSDASAMEYLIIHVRRGPKIKLTDGNDCTASSSNKGWEYLAKPLGAQLMPHCIKAGISRSAQTW